MGVMKDRLDIFPFSDEYKDNFSYSQGYFSYAIMEKTSEIQDDWGGTRPHDLKGPQCSSLAQVYFNYGYYFYAKNQLDQALVCYQQGVRIQPDQAEAYCQIGKIFYIQGHFQAALEAYRQALQIEPDQVAIYRQLEELFATPNQCEVALEYYQQHFDPHQWITSILLADILFKQNQLDRSLQYYQQALDIHPHHRHAHYQRGVILLKKGQFLEGWPEYEWRLHNFPLPPQKWEGSPLAGRRLLVYWEQSLEDTLQFIRYLPLLQEGIVTFICPTPLLSLCQSLSHEKLIITDTPPHEAIDVWVFLLSLPYYFTSSLEHLPASIPYLYPDPHQINQWQKFFQHDRLNIGIVWSDEICPLSEWVPLTHLSHLAFFGLQTSLGNIDPKIFPEGSFISLAEKSQDFGELAAILGCLDLILSIGESVVAHLAGALGKPVWVILPWSCHWRWLEQRQESPWYPTMRLFRQTSYGEWKNVIVEVEQALYQQYEIFPYLRDLTQDFPKTPQKLAEIYMHCGDFFYSAPHLELAITCYQQALRIHPHAETCNNLAALLSTQGHWEAALAYCQQALRLQPDYAPAYNNLGTLLMKAKKSPQQALKCYQTALQLHPHYVEAYNNLAMVFESQHQLQQALECYQIALHIQPQNATTHFNYATVLLKMGHFQEGWQEYEWRLTSQSFHYHVTQPIWEGSPLNGRRLLVYCEQGFGDTLQFIRYLPLIQGGTRILACQAPLAPLLQGQAGIDELIIVEMGQTLTVPFDTWIFLLSLPKIFSTTLENLPHSVPYLFPSSDKKAKWTHFFKKENFNVGIAWAGRPTHKNDLHRSCQVTEFDPLSKWANLFSLQTGEAAHVPLPEGILSLTHELHDFSDTAAIITCLDLIICVDTAIAHLAGALGKPVWLVLPFVADWRWLQERHDNPWYPTMRLFRQTQPEDWGGVFAQIETELSKRFSSSQLPSPTMPENSSFATALAHCQQTVRLHPQSAQAYKNLGLILQVHHQLEAALDAYQHARSLQPEDAEIYFAMGNIWGLQNHLELALEAYQHATALHPQHTDAFYNQGVILHKLHRSQEALKAFEHTIQLNPHYVQAYQGLSMVLYAQNQFDQAIAYCQQILRLRPHEISAYINMSSALYAKNQFDLALACCQQALQFCPQEATIHWNYAAILLKKGELTLGWQEYEWRIQAEPQNYTHFTQPRWDGRSLQGRRLLVHWEQGFGDSFHFIRYLPLIQGGTVIFACQPALESVLKNTRGIDQVLANSIPQPPQVDYDVWSPLMSLPHIFGTTFETIPHAVPYLHPDLQKVTFLRHHFNPQQLNIGIVWQGNPFPNRHRFCTLKDFHFLAMLPQLNLFSLQVGEAAHQEAEFPLTALPIQDFSDTAALIACLDLVISIDTAVAHLAGALGKPVWLLLPYYASDWRWLQERHDSPWYPTMRLFWQSQPGDWSSVFTQMQQEIIEKRDLFKYLSQSTALFPETPQALAQCFIQTAHLLHRQQQLELAVESYHVALRIHPQAEFYNDLAGIFFEQQQWQAASECCQQALRLRPDFAQTYKHLGLIFQAQHQYQTAWEYFQHALHYDSQDAETYFSIGNLLDFQNHLHDALHAYQKAITLQPNYVQAYHNQALIFHKLGQPEAALAAFQHALHFNPQCIEAYHGMALVYETLHQFEQVVRCCQHALQINSQDIDAYIIMSKAYDALNQIDEAMRCCQHALRQVPQEANAHWNYALILLKKGHFMEAWKEYEWRIALGKIKHSHLTQPRWEGSPLNGRTLLVHWEQGFGDTLQFSRYIQKIQGGKVILVCQPPLETLLKETMTTSSTMQAYDIWIPLLSLPRVFATTLETLPGSVPYLYPPSHKVARWRNTFDQTSLNIGIVWQGSPIHENNRQRSCQFADFAGIAELPKINLFSLQLEVTMSSIPSFTKEIKDFSDTAAIIIHLDLVITIDTAIAHLAGALGKPVWVLLPFAAEWRWLEARHDSPWYPTMQLFRQPQREDWQSVFKQVKRELLLKTEMLKCLRWSTFPLTPQQLAQTYIDAGHCMDNQPILAQECQHRAARIHSF